jgi:hypothetical protein
VAWAIASIGAYAVHVMAPQLSEAIAGIVLGGAVYAAIDAFSPSPAREPASVPAADAA